MFWLRKIKPLSFLLVLLGFFITFYLFPFKTPKLVKEYILGNFMLLLTQNEH